MNTHSEAKDEKKVTVTFTYEGQLCFSIEGECTMEMTETELKLFKEVNEKAKKDGTDNILAYFEEELPESLYWDIHSEIERDIRYRDAEEIVEREGISCFANMDEEEYEELSFDELVAQFVDENLMGIYEFLIEKIEIK